MLLGNKMSYLLLYLLTLHWEFCSADCAVIVSVLSTRYNVK